MTQELTKKLTAAETALAEARGKLVIAERDEDPETVLVSRKTARDLAVKIADLEAVVAAWRTKVAEAEKDEKRGRLPGAVAAADPAPVRKTLEPIASEYVKCRARLAHLENEARTAIARQGLLAADAETLGRACGESVSIDRLPPRYFDALILMVTALETKVPELVERVLSSTGYLDGCIPGVRVAECRAAGLETDQEIVAAALDGSLAVRLREAARVKKAADDAARAARLAAEKEYQAASDEYPYHERQATPAQRARLEAAEIAMFGKDKAAKLRTRRGGIAVPINEQAPE